MPTSRRWLDVAVIWVAVVGVQALIVFLLTQYQLMRLQAWTLEQLSVALREGNTQYADMLSSHSMVSYYPVDMVVQFALVGLAVIAVAWTGRRALAVAIPLIVALASIGPAYSSSGGLAPHPIAGFDTGGLWGGLVLGPAQANVDGSPIWPLLLGVSVQSALLLLPLTAAPPRSTALPLTAALRRALLPAAVFAVAALVVIPTPSSEDIYRVPLVALMLGLLAGCIATAAGAAWIRLPAAVLAPAVLAPYVVQLAVQDTAEALVIGSIAAAGAVVVVLSVIGSPAVVEHVRSWRHTAVPV